jgi:hypothetical protein
MVQMGVDNFKNNLSNPQREYLWEWQCANPIGGGDGETLLLRCQTASRPGRGHGGIFIPYKQSAGIKVPGKLTYPHTLDTTMIEGEDKAIHDIIHAWQQLIVNDKTNIGIGDVSIKTDVYLKLLSTKGEETLKIRVVGVYPENVPDVPLIFTGEGTVMYPVTWSYDRWEEV